MSYYANTTQPTATYPYGGYQAHYPYQATGYNPWAGPYYHPYMPQTAPRVAQPATAPAQPRPAATSSPAPAPQRQATFQTYTPTPTSYARESTTTSTARGGRRQSNMKGLFTKERESTN